MVGYGYLPVQGSVSLSVCPSGEEECSQMIVSPGATAPCFHKSINARQESLCHGNSHFTNPESHPEKLELAFRSGLVKDCVIKEELKTKYEVEHFSSHAGTRLSITHD